MLELLYYLLHSIPSHLVDFILYFFDNIDIVDFCIYIFSIFCVLVIFCGVRYAFNRLKGGCKI